VEGFLNKNDKGQGGMGIFALSSSSPRAEKQGRGWHTPAAALGRRPGARERLWSEGNERGRREGPIPGRGSARGGPRWPSHDGRRQRAAGGTGSVSQRRGGGQGGWGKALGNSGARFPPLTLDRKGRSTEGRHGGGAVWLRRELEAAEVAVGRRSGAGVPL